MGAGTEPSAGSKGSNEHRLSRGAYTKVDSDINFFGIQVLHGQGSECSQWHFQGFCGRVRWELKRSPQWGSRDNNEHSLSREAYTKVDRDITFIDIKQI